MKFILWSLLKRINNEMYIYILLHKICRKILPMIIHIFVHVYWFNQY